MDIVSPIVDVVSRLWNCTSSHASYITDLEETLTSLRMKMEELIAIRDDVRLKVQLEEEQGKLRSKQVEGWLTRVQETDNKVNEIFSKHEGISSNGFRFQSSYKLGKKATKLLSVIQALISNGEFPEVAFQQRRQAPEGLCEMPMRDQNILGIESNLDKVLGGLKDDNVGIIGLYGMGGVGKSTLLKKINNQLPKSGHDAFDFALWVVASGNATIETIQQNIIGKLKIPYRTLSNKTVDEVCNAIYNTLKNRKYILMLDDLWKMVDLFEKVGIPKPDNGNKSKIIFTTRSKGVCSQMEAQLVVRVECLPWEDAWSLFQEKVGRATLSAQIESYAVKVAEECKGLPLALITLGRAMSDKKDPHEWSHALDQLQNFPAEFPDLEEDVFPALQLSYDYLADSTKQQCFLYCSLFPEDYNIPSDNLVDLWMGEGYLNKKHDLKKARDYGYSIIQDLKRVCLLESGSEIEFDSVKMHDMIRDMALKVANTKFLFLGKAELMRAKSIDQDWNDNVEKMSLWGTQWEKEKILRETSGQNINRSSYYSPETGYSAERDQEKLTLTRECPKLSTLLFKLSSRTSLLGLFNFIPNVRVLDLSKTTNIRRLPEAISKLKNLEHLDISRTEIKRLPKVMKNLSKLRYLLMNYMQYLEECPSEIISCLAQLLVFRMNYLRSSEELLRGLENLQNLQEISICLDTAEIMNLFLESEKLQLYATDLELGNSSAVLNWCPNNLRNLESLFIRVSNVVAIKCSNLSNLMAFNCLRYVHVYSCCCLVDLDFLAYAPSLVKLQVEDCISLQRIVRVEEAERVFLSLKEIDLYNLPCLKNFCNKPLAFPTLEIIAISKCPKLKQNLFNDIMPTNTNLTKIMADSIWWNSLNWSDDHLKHHFSQFYKKTY